ncbi:hypothetical protein G6F62_011401 [Rhizopus arrhizus]|nr:hypothetical protein G6F62_011401 [Rhizopus arrhizus]
MTTLITKGQAACLVLGESVTEANRVKCKAIVNGTPFDIVYTSERGNTRPIAIGKVVAERDPFTYLDYPDTPPPCHVDSSSFIETNDPSVPNESSSCALDNVESSSSSCKSTDSYNVIKPTKASVMDLLRIFLTANPAGSVKNHYDLKSLTEKDIFNLVIANMPNVGDSFTANQINKWLTSDGNFGRPKSTRQGCDVIKARNLWVLKPEFMGKLTKTTPWVND